MEHVVNFLKLVLRVLKTVLRNKKNLIFKNRLKHLKRKCFRVLRQKQSCSYGVENGCKNFQRCSFKPLKPFCLSSKQGLMLTLNILYNVRLQAETSYNTSFRSVARVNKWIMMRAVICL